MIKVRIKKQAKARTGYQVDGSLANDISPMGGGDYNREMGKPKLKESRYITADPREESNVEAEGGELVYGDVNGDFFPETQIIKGPRHNAGGVPLNLPEDTFIFSDTRSMKIKDCEILTMFGKPCGKKSYTPANLAKQYDIQKYRVLLEDPNSNAIEKKTAELMIKNYVVKLGCLALKQESMKGFPQGIPVVARPCMEAKGITEEQILPSKELAQLKSQLESQKEKEEQGGNENFLNEAMGMNEGRPVAQPQPMQEPPQQLQPAPQPMMQQGGYSDIYRQQMQEQEGAQQQMMQLMQQVQSALEQGAAPEQVVQALLYDQIPPESIAQIFIELGMPEQDVIGLIQQSMAAAQQPQQGQQSMAKDGLSVMNGGGTVEINKDEYDTPEEFQQALRNAYAKVGRGGKIYVIHDGKKYLQKVSATIFNKYEEDDLARNWHDNAVAAATYQSIEQGLQDRIARKKLFNETIVQLREKENYKKSKKPGYWPTVKDSVIDNLTEDDIVNAHLNHQKRNLRLTTVKDRLDIPVFGSYMFNNNGDKLREYKSTGSGEGDDKGFYDVVKGTTSGRDLSDSEIEAMYDKIKANGFTSLQKSFKNLGVNYDPKDPSLQAEAKIEQAAFLGMNSLMKQLDSEDNDFTLEEKQALLNFSPIEGFKPYGRSQGFEDEVVAGVKNITPIDGKRGNTDAGQFEYIHGLSFEDIEEEAEDPLEECLCMRPDGSEIPTTRLPSGECPPCQEDVNVSVPGGNAEWWLQDTIKTAGAFGDLMGIKKYMPWAPGVDLEEPRPTFLDPTRELAANAEQANIQTQGMAQFSGPQALSARSSGIQGQAAKNAADILAKYNNSNVNIANQFELKATDIRNQESMLRQATNQRVYDQTTMANQQYDNSKLAMRNNLRNQYTNAITNRWKTDAMNQMYPDYKVFPGRGGQMRHIPNSKNPSPTSSATYESLVDKWISQGYSKEQAAKNARYEWSTLKNNSQPASHPNMYPEFNTGGYVYFNPWFDDGI
jgi:hypothetical protein